jgi:ribosomal-protein-alanine N-acetyltransferase
MNDQQLTLYTDRLCLREIKETDWQPVLRYQRQAEYLTYYPWNERHADDVKQFLDAFIAWQHEKPRTKFQLAVTVTATQEMVGLCGIRQTFAHAHEAELGYEIALDHWGRGYATETAQTLLRFAFDSLQVHRVWANCIAMNTASIRVLHKLNMRHEGTLRENRWMKNRWWDTAVYAILVHEWQSGNPV